MKIRLIGTRDEFVALWPLLEAHESYFDKFQVPKKGRNPKYQGSVQYLQYLEIDIDTVLKLLK